MGKEKRKNRLDKGTTQNSSGEFVGFGAFAETSSQVSTGSLSGVSQLKWSPIYAGSDSQLSILFKKIGQKRDGSTKAKSLLEVNHFFQDDANPKKEQISALAHLVFLYHSKLSYDDFSSVRSTSLTTLNSARKRLPKAWGTLLDHNPEVLGMIWCAQADPSSEVKLVASEMCHNFSSEESSCVWKYASRILRYSKAKNMNDDLFARKSGDEGLSDREREQLDERYERIVGCALVGVALWVQTFPETSFFQYSVLVTDSFLWKPMTSTKNSLRLKAYQVLGVMCQFGKSVVYGPVGMASLPNLLLNVLAQEKEPSNIPTLLEAILLYATSGDSTGLDRNQLVKVVNKMLRKACFTSSPSAWGPTILPLLASFADETLTVSVLKSMLDGRDATIGLGDSLLIAMFVAECSSYFLLKSFRVNTTVITLSNSFVNCWLETLKIYLSTSGVTSVSQDADTSLGKMLGKTLCRFDEASVDREIVEYLLRKKHFGVTAYPTCC